MWTVLALAAGTLISEDAALAGAAGLSRNGTLSPYIAAAAVGLGIWAGDALLYVIGTSALRWPPAARFVARRWRRSELQALAARLDRRAGWAIIASRFLPGTRVPLYVAAGLFRVPAAVFLISSALAVAAWTTAIVMGAQWLL